MDQPAAFRHCRLIVGTLNPCRAVQPESGQASMSHREVVGIDDGLLDESLRKPQS